ncbi:Na(+)/H(+) antiporter subunit B [Paenibacillus sp. ACRRX]|uniref:Na(+)/H(+) antiporter subunit B n=1 Tax=unclassified Paenibacillus TaxID=185978 RepID=UPI001EF50074|nr:MULTISPECIES: Na(+)/H(+) antiporter subunit B [unclassified Paenibacillus]MCG7408793.1 Na(+)/H(+) antiporter subunit B [Paenibacillus sp. ACRRX]MDK8183563.1 Na(+)/H(+) antiporter subunit B [Paenibacillus sp. UMB4589-SE434]
MKSNDVILQSVTRVAAVIILTFSIYLFMNGHHDPGGGFIGGLSMASSIVLLYLSFGVEKVRENIRVDFKKLSAVGVLIAVATGMASTVFGKPFLTQTFGHVDLPIFGDTELASALIFDTGVALAVIGTAVNIILSISEDR